MRICKDGIFLVKPGTLPGERRKEEPKKKKKTARPLTAAQKRKVDELRKRVAEGSQAGNYFKGAEIR